MKNLFILIMVAFAIEFAISTDTLVSGKHFFPDTDPYQLGFKSLAVNLSDMAAMGAKPRWILLALTLPRNLTNNDNPWLSKFSEGFFDLANSYQIALIGGDTTSGPLNINVQIIGEVKRGKALRRNNAPAGDDVWIWVSSEMQHWHCDMSCSTSSCRSKKKLVV